jgi:methyl-accepting chemotaxis protein
MNEYVEIIIMLVATAIMSLIAWLVKKAISQNEKVVEQRFEHQSEVLHTSLKGVMGVATSTNTQVSNMERDFKEFKGELKDMVRGLERRQSETENRLAYNYLAKEAVDDKLEPIKNDIQELKQITRENSKDITNCFNAMRDIQKE